MKKIILFLIIPISILFINLTKAESLNEFIIEGDYIPNYYVRVEETGEYCQFRFLKRASDGQVVYSLNPCEDIETLKAYDSYTSSFNVISKELWERIKQIAYYGYGFLYQNLDDWYVFTQISIWRESNPELHIYFATANGSKTFEDVASSQQIIRWIDLFSSEDPDFGDSVFDVDLGESINIVDTKERSKYFNDNNLYLFKNSSGIEVIQKENSMNYTITPTTFGTHTINFFRADNRFSTLPTLYYLKDKGTLFAAGTLTHEITINTPELMFYKEEEKTVKEKWTNYDGAWGGWATDEKNFSKFTGNINKGDDPTKINIDGVVRSGKSAWAMGIEFYSGIKEKRVDLIMGQHTKVGEAFITDNGNGTATITLIPQNSRLKDIKVGIYTIKDMPNGNGNLTPKGTNIVTNFDNTITITVPYTNNSKGQTLYAFIHVDASIKVT